MPKASTTINELRSEVIAAVVELFEGDKQAAESWLNQPLRAILYETPLEYMNSPEKIRTLREVIGRLEHGVWT